MENGFGADFLWGAASASAQVEGGWDADGRTPSIWDVAKKRHVKHGDNCHVGCDHYHHMKEDVALMKEMGLKSYRFSISWSRVIPQEGKVNEKGLRFYSDLVDELLANGIEPLVTIFHWDLPVWVQKKGGWMSRATVPLFREYTRVVVEALSDRVQWWMPMNEPQCFIMNGHMQGMHAPFKHYYLALVKLTKVCMEAYAESVDAIRENAKRPPKVGMAMASGAFTPKSTSPVDVEEARHKSFYFGTGVMSNRWWCDPMLLGKGVSAYGVYHISDAFAKKVCRKLDFLGLNLYEPQNYAGWGGDGTALPFGAPRSSIGWVVDGSVLYWAPKFMHERYGLPILISENGFADNDFVCLDGKVHDPLRTDFMYRYLRELKKVIQDGVPVIGYQHWSVMDNFEWAEGFDARFGLIYVDYSSGKRTIKDSGYEYKKIIESNGECL